MVSVRTRTYRARRWRQSIASPGHDGLYIFRRMIPSPLRALQPIAWLEPRGKWPPGHRQRARSVVRIPYKPIDSISENIAHRSVAMGDDVCFWP
jgi:hypothetical protein